MELLDTTRKCWTAKSEAESTQWAEELLSCRDRVIKAGKKFHEWAPLRVYLSVTRARNPKVSFSLRYLGQEVATLVDEDGMQLTIDRKRAELNQDYFDIPLHGTFPWRSKEAKEFRAHFKNLKARKAVRSPEHRIESEFIKQMSSESSTKFEGSLKNIQPVLFAGCPFQLPLPISGNTGKPVAKRGNIDIVARRGTGKGTRISIWELKRPGVTGKSIEQAFIYGVTLIKMLRTAESGKLWYRDVFGFSGKLPEALIVECVIAVSLASEAKRSAFVEKLQQFVEQNPAQQGNDKLKFCIAFYEEDPLRISSFVKI